MDVSHVPPNTIGRATRRPAFCSTPIRERVVRSTAPLGGSPGRLQRGDLPPTVPEDDGEVGEGETVGVESPWSHTYSAIAERHETLGNTGVCAHTEGGRR